jgi:hypothetical protein
MRVPSGDTAAVLAVLAALRVGVIIRKVSFED